MVVTCVTVYVKLERVHEFSQATIQNHNESIKESGNLRFDVLQCQDDPTQFMIYEAYESEDAAAAHKNTEHYLKWREQVATWMVKPREGIAHHVIRPLERSAW